MRSFFHDTITIEDAGRIVADQMERREANFLWMLENNVFGYDRSPYLPLFSMAGIEFEDVRRELEARGLEGTLRTLRDAGVYVTFEEVKGRKPIVRDGRELFVPKNSFNNPRLTVTHLSQSGGSTGPATTVGHDLAYQVSISAYKLIAWEARGWNGIPWALWRGVLPDGSGLANVLHGGHAGNLPERWFSPVLGKDQPRSMWRYRLRTRVPLLMARSVGVKIPSPERVRLDEPQIVARWMGDMLASRGACILQTPVSRALRVAISAQALGIDLTGSFFRVAGEPLTPAKAEAIKASGAQINTSYGYSEIGRIAFGCGSPVGVNDVHLSMGQAALIQHNRLVPGTDIEVPAFLFTALHASAPKILLNAESDDYGTVAERSCGCLLGELGLRTHIGEVRSFQKLTGEGMTLVGSTIIRILEEELPATHGGSPLDYQLVEEEDADGFTHFRLRVSPRIDIESEDAVARTFIETLSRWGGRGGIVQLFEQGRVLQVDREEPEWTGRGKLMSLHVTKRLENTDE